MLCYILIPVTLQDALQINLCWTYHVPDGDSPVLAAGHHHVALGVEAEVENGLTVVSECVDQIARLNVPDPN